MANTGPGFGVLGPLQLSARGGALVQLGAPKQRAVLAMLVLNRNRAVSVDSLIDAVWEQQPVPAARTSIHSYVSNLRRLIGSAGYDPSKALASVPPGYQLNVADADCDLGRFITEKNAGVHAAASGRFEDASSYLSAALAEWRGPFLDDLREFAFVDTFATALSQSAQSLETNAHLISKVYFPRLVVPGAIVFGSFLDFLIGWCVLVAVTISFGYWHWELVAITPLLLFIQGCTVMGIGLVLAALNAQYRDVKHTINFFVQIFMLATPVIYPLSRLPEWIRPYMFFNPMAAVVTTYRVVLKGDAIDWNFVGLSLAMAILYFCAGTWFFRKRELTLADIV